MKTLRLMWQCHRFFVRESRSYAGGWNPRFPLQWPKAWLRFMWFSFRDRHWMSPVPESKRRNPFDP